MHCRDRKIFLSHIICEPVDLAPGVAVYDCLRDGECLVEITECVQLPFFSFHSYVELLNAFQGELVFLYKNADRFLHEAASDLENF